jgi:hypothetical protein
MTTALRARHATLFALGLLALVFIFVGCDTDGLDDDRHDRGDVIYENDVRVATFTLNDRDNRGEFRFLRTFSESGGEVQYETDREFYPGLADLLTERTVNEGLVMLYVSDVIDEDGLRRSGWTALPLALGFDEATEDAPNGDGFVDYVLTTTYTFDVGELYVNLVASDDFTIDFLQENQGLLDDLEDIRFRLVAIPGGGFARGIDYSDYEAVKQAFNLPD